MEGADMTMSALYLPAYEPLVAIEPLSLVVNPSEEHPAAHLFSFPPVESAFRIATVAHVAVGQRRRGGEPYMIHPLQVAAMAFEWNLRLGSASHACFEVMRVRLVVDALLHDVEEDTKLTGYDLAALGVDPHTINDVRSLSILGEGVREDVDFFRGCARRYEPWWVKAADRCSNLLGFAREAVAGARNQSIKNYVESTRTFMLPVYEDEWPPGVLIAERDLLLSHLGAAIEIAERAAAA